MKKTISGEHFFRTAIFQDGCRSFIFATDKDLLALQDSQFWLMDGTFETVPNLMYQLYTIHGRIGRSDEDSAIVQLVYVLMDSKQQTAYEDVFAYIASQMESHSIQAHFMISDFEIAAINAVQVIFPEISPGGCYFHLKQAFSKHLKLCGLQEIYMNNRLFAKYVNMLGALAFLSASDIPNGFDGVKEKMLEEFTSLENLNEFLRYISVNFVHGRPRISNNGIERFTAPRFPPSLWTVNERTNLGFPRTSNNVEAWKNRWKNLLVRRHVGVYKCIEELRKEQHAVSSKIHNGLLLGFVVTSKRKQFLERESALREFLALQAEMPIQEFLELLALRLEAAH